MSDDYSVAHKLVYKLKEWNIKIQPSQMDQLVAECHQALQKARQEGHENAFDSEIQKAFDGDMDVEPL